jgi:hypothetical protein
MACLLKNEPASYALWPKVKQRRLWSRSESESEQGAQWSEGVDPKPRELSMVSVKPQ